MTDKVSIEKVNKAHYEQVVNLLHKNMSPFHPNSDQIDLIWRHYIAQENVRAIVIVDQNTVIGFGSISIEIKIRGGKMGHIEDIVIDSSRQGKGYGKLLIRSLNKIAEIEKCYKVSLQCQKHNVAFYEKCGFVNSGFSMQLFFKIN